MMDCVALPDPILIHPTPIHSNNIPTNTIYKIQHVVFSNDKRMAILYQYKIGQEKEKKEEKEEKEEKVEEEEKEEKKNSIQIFDIHTIEDIIPIGKIEDFNYWWPSIIFIPNNTAILLQEDRDTAEIWDYEKGELVWKDPMDQAISFRSSILVDPKGTCLWMVDRDNQAQCFDLATLTYTIEIQPNVDYSIMDFHVIGQNMVVTNGMELNICPITRVDHAHKNNGNSGNTYEILENSFSNPFHGNAEELADWIIITDESQIMTRLPNNKSIITFIHGGDLVTINTLHVTQEDLDVAGQSHSDAERKSYLPPEWNKTHILDVEYLPCLRRYVILARRCQHYKRNEDDVYVLLFKVPNTTKRTPVKRLTLDSIRLLKGIEYNDCTDSYRLMPDGRLFIIRSIVKNIDDLQTSVVPDFRQKQIYCYELSKFF